MIPRYITFSSASSTVYQYRNNDEMKLPQLHLESLHWFKTTRLHRLNISKSYGSMKKWSSLTPNKNKIPSDIDHSAQ